MILQFIDYMYFELQATHAKIEKCNISGLTLDDLSARRIRLC